VQRPTVATVSLAAIAGNLRAIQTLLDRDRLPGTSAPGVIAVVKANAYGHGATNVGLALEAAGAGMLACADIEEGVALRDAGVTIPILVFGAQSVSDLDGVFTHGLTPTVSTPGAAKALEQAAAKRGVRLHCHLKIDTGMNRLGFRHDNLRRTLPPVLASPNLTFDAVYTHFATADEPRITVSRRAACALRYCDGRTRRAGLEEPAPACREFRGAPARHPHLVRLGATRTSSLWHRAAATCRGRSRPVSRPVTDVAYRRGEGHSDR
jgi:alanine racemase